MRLAALPVLWRGQGTHLLKGSWSRPAPHTFATLHDAQIWRCFCTLTGVQPAAPTFSAQVTVSLPLASGSIGMGPMGEDGSRWQHEKWSAQASRFVRENPESSAAFSRRTASPSPFGVHACAPHVAQT